MTEELREMAAIGQVLSPHGVAGLLKVFPYTDYPERCRELERVYLELNGKRIQLKVEKASLYGRFWLLKFTGVDSREQAGRLTGGVLLIPKAERVTLPQGHYFFDQIEGLRVYSASGELLGEITGVISTGGHDLYRLKYFHGGNSSGKEILLPAVRRFIRQIDPEAGRMVVDLPEGLAEL